MGVCSSCLGRDMYHELSDEDEQSRLLFDDPHANHYGSFGEHHTGATQADPQEVQRETEALQKVVTMTSNHLVDIFALVPQSAHPATVSPSATTGFPAQEARLVRYQEVLSKVSASDEFSKSNILPTDHTPAASDGWLSEDDEVDEVKGHTPVKSEGIGPLLGSFADADSVK
ncbi:unnamed protein product [Diplocarpon coronariae]|uniref:Late endosomal/lysosomal adaptor and MAPK and MTOR activator-domain-containing protein n=1 Tax=Diplocarpon coronariae TaxID=2795749 RepID=A0A218Z2U1_9HELO|nr:hypothetical protein B2J93_2111 [Marssonina coronariae]